MDVVVGNIPLQRHRQRHRIFVGLEDVRRRLDVVRSDRKPLGKIFQRRCDRLAASEIARHAGKADLIVGNRDLAHFQPAYLIDQQQRGGIETRRCTARQNRLIDDFGAAKAGAGSIQQLALAGRQRCASR